uniref:Uncharacterized protein n=1 Tax=Anguilla anguilla TaxID=7936 RepID=A0A0E9VQU0_ANGAN
MPLESPGVMSVFPRHLHYPCSARSSNTTRGQAAPPALKLRLNAPG